MMLTYKMTSSKNPIEVKVFVRLHKPFGPLVIFAIDSCSVLPQEIPKPFPPNYKRKTKKIMEKTIMHFYICWTPKDYEKDNNALSIFHHATGSSVGRLAHSFSTLSDGHRLHFNFSVSDDAKKSSILWDAWQPTENSGFFHHSLILLLPILKEKKSYFSFLSQASTPLVAQIRSTCNQKHYIWLPHNNKPENLKKCLASENFNFFCSNF